MLKKIKEHISNLGNEPSEKADQEQKEPDLINNACAALLIETALADKVFNEEELASMKQTLNKVYKVDEKDIEELINESKRKVSESTSLYEYTRLINDLCDYEDKIRLISNLWSIAFADQHLDKYEEYLIRKISDLLHVSHKDFIQQKLLVKEAL
ncbi:uncharacterized protein METZ01_LOCUS53389 [marine metagenome]|jgi:uncharacterized tellurite resistance protein B-like protein|uniref:Co-chaperone DjlA N-terminal domain-containing protein n=1 Tax=marine metagenome TaxID=408172 RepID=A0A381S8W9_9ZZZZ|tara:strand:- start:2222 stop:2686 length:465 start_codon:yes stop_codon:yes gene_type:complete